MATQTTTPATLSDDTRNTLARNAITDARRAHRRITTWLAACAAGDTTGKRPPSKTVKLGMYAAVDRFVRLVDAPDEIRHPRNMAGVNTVLAYATNLGY